MAKESFRVKKALNIEPNATTTSDEKGDMKITSAGLLNVHDGSSYNEIVDTDTPQTLTNKTITAAALDVGNLHLEDNTISSTDPDGDIILDPDGAGNIQLVVFDVGVVEIGSSSVQVNADGEVDITGNLDVDNIHIEDRAIQASGSGAFDIFHSGTGNIVIQTAAGSISVESSGGSIDLNGVTVDTSQVVSAVTQLNVDNLRLDGNTLSSTDTNGNVNITPNGTGNIVLSSDELDASVQTTLSLGTSNTATSVSIGTGTGVNTVNIGGANTTINMTGTVNNENVTNLNITDKLITLNDGGGAASGSNSGIEIEENAVATGYVTTSGDRNSWIFKAPNTAGIATVTPGASGFTLDGSEVKGPGSATDEALARFDGTTGKLIQNSVVTATDAGTVSGVTQLNVDNLRLDGNSISSTNTDGNITLDPNGVGVIDAQASVTVVGSVRSDTSLILEETGAGTDTITVQAPSSIASSYTLTLPVDDGNSGEVLSTDGSGVLSWISASSGSTYSFIGAAKIGGSSRTWTKSGNTLGSFGTASSISPSVISNPGTGTIQTTGVTTPKFTVNSLAAGTYKVTLGVYLLGDSAANIRMAINDGTTTGPYSGTQTPTAGRGTWAQALGIFTYGGSGNVTFELFGAVSSGNVSAEVGDDGDLVFCIEKVA